MSKQKTDVEFLIERYKKIGARHPFDMFKTLSPKHPYTKSLIKKHQIDVMFHKNKISRKKFYKEYEMAEKEIKKQEQKLKLKLKLGKINEYEKIR